MGYTAGHMGMGYTRGIPWVTLVTHWVKTQCHRGSLPGHENIPVSLSLQIQFSYTRHGHSLLGLFSNWHLAKCAHPCF